MQFFVENCGRVIICRFHGANHRCSGRCGSRRRVCFCLQRKKKLWLLQLAKVQLRAQRTKRFFLTGPFLVALIIRRIFGISAPPRQSALNRGSMKDEKKKRQHVPSAKAKKAGKPPTRSYSLSENALVTSERRCNDQ